MSLLVLLVRHAAREAPDRLVGWMPGIGLTDRGREQAKALAVRLADVPFAGLYTSPLQRCVETAEAIAAGRKRPGVVTEEGLGELHAGRWEGQKLAVLGKRREWAAVQLW